MNKKILVLAVSLFAVRAYAQNITQNEYEEWKPSQNEYNDFDIGKYTTPDIVRNQLGINFNFHSNHSRNDYSSLNWDKRIDYSNINGNISSSFSRYVNTRKRISSLSGGLSIGEDYHSSKNKLTSTVDNSTTIDNISSLNQQNSLYLDWSDKWYFSKLIFMQYGIQSAIHYNYSQEKTKNQTDDSNQKEKVFRINISPELGIGYGRIENVRDARQAVYIANALSKSKVLTRNLTNDELFELSQIISTVKNKRFLDARLHLIEEITTLDSFFENNDLLADNGAAYFTTLYDMWQYGDLFPRKSGYEISLLLHPYYNYQNIKYTPDIQNMIYHSNRHLMSLNFSYEKPFKLKWQHSLSTEIYGGINSSSVQNKQTGNDYKNKTKYNSFAASAYYSLGYYPNTRTHIQVTAQQQISKNIYDDEGHNTNFYSEISANLYYYFSPNLRLAGDCNLYYLPQRFKGNNGDFDNRNTFSSMFNIQLTYFIF
jgi:hypothetical protein